MEKESCYTPGPYCDQSDCRFCEEKPLADFKANLAADRAKFRAGQRT